MKKIARNIAGALLILLGIVGLFLPFLQGFLFIALGIGMLEFDRKTHVLAHTRRFLVRRGIPRKWMYPTRARRLRRIEKRREHKLRASSRLDLEKVID